MKSRYGCKGAPRGLIYLPEGISNDVPWKSQKCIIPRTDDKTPETAGRAGGKRAATVDVDGDEGVEGSDSEVRPRKVSFIQLFPLSPESNPVRVEGPCNGISTTSHQRVKMFTAVSAMVLSSAVRSGDKSRFQSCRRRWSLFNVRRQPSNGRRHTGYPKQGKAGNCTVYL